MRKIREVIRLRAMGLSRRKIAASLDMSHSTVMDMLYRVQACDLDWPLPEDLDDSQLEAMLYPPNPVVRGKPIPQWSEVHAELKRKHVTLQLLWTEYKRSHADGYQYSQYCELYRNWVNTIDICCRQVHRAGEKMFVDFAGDTVPITDRITGEISEGHLFVAVLGASNYTYVEVTPSEDLPAWISAHTRAFEFFGGVPEVIVPDNLKSGVQRPCYYEPDINPTYHEMACYYGTVVIPTRVRKPKDKAKVENAVLQAERWILAPLRDHTFFSLAEANKAVAAAIEELNNKPFQKLEGTRRSTWESIDRPALNPLPMHRYQYAFWKKAKVNIDYHVEVMHNYYSVPYQLIRKDVEVRATDSTVELFCKGQRAAVHVRQHGKGIYSTNPEHRPPAHSHYLDWTPERLIEWAAKTGPHTAELVRVILDEASHPERGYKACLGVMRIAGKHSPERMEGACMRALGFGLANCRSVKAILDKGLDRVVCEPNPIAMAPQDHCNIRGPQYYGGEEKDDAYSTDH